VLEEFNSGTIDKEYALNIFRGSSYLLNSQYQEAITYLERILEKNPADADVHYNLGVAYHHLNEHKKSIDYLKMATVHNPQDAEIYIQMASGYLSLQQEPLARENLLQAKGLFQKAGDNQKAEEVQELLNELN
jgi:tetratricopeptide (TPR) repeat protein